jgi:hypothetical protein
LKVAIGTPIGLVISVDAGKGLGVAVDDVYPGVEHRESMRHLWKISRSITMVIYLIITCGQPPRLAPLRSPHGQDTGEVP